MSITPGWRTNAIELYRETMRFLATTRSDDTCGHRFRDRELRVRSADTGSPALPPTPLLPPCRASARRLRPPTIGRSPGLPANPVVCCSESSGYGPVPRIV
jgi:hypothetical protein